MIGILISTMLFAHVGGHAVAHVTPHVTTVHETAHPAGVHETGHTTTRPAVKTVRSSNVHMSRSGYDTNTMWRNWMIFHMFNSDVSQMYQLDVKDKHGKLHTVHLTKGQYDRAIKAKHLLWVNGSVIADGKRIN
jgi:hypothetical protein